jgi:hypothetical protein
MQYGQDITYAQLIEKVNNGATLQHIPARLPWKNLPTGSLKVDGVIYATWNHDPCCDQTYWVEVRFA